MSTLVHDPFYDAVAPFLGMTFDELLAAKHPSAWLTFERGECTEQEFLDRFFRDGRVYDQEGLKRLFEEGYRYLDGAEPLLEELRAGGVAVHLCTNYPIWYRKIEERLRLGRFARWTFVSCKAGLRKPSPAAYHRMLEAVQVDPADCVFVDDSPVNCEGAQMAGMHAIPFQGFAPLRAELKRLGFPVRPEDPREGEQEP